MRLKLWSILSILLLVGSNDGRPSKLANPEIIEENDKKSLAKGIVDESSSRQLIEPRSSSVVKTDSRYTGRTENSTEFNDKYYRNNFSPGIINNFEIDENFGLPNDWKLLGSSRVLKSKINERSNESDRLVDEIKNLQFSIMKHENLSNFDRYVRDNITHKSYNDKFTKFYYPIFNGKLSPNIRQDDHKSLNDTRKMLTMSRSKGNGSLSRISLKAKNRVVLKSNYHNKPLRYETNLRPLSHVGSNIPHETTNYELKNWPNEAVQNLDDLFNYEKYTSNIETPSHQKLSFNYGNDPIYVGTKKRRKKPGNKISVPEKIKNQYHKLSTLDYKKFPSSTQQTLASSSINDGESIIQPNKEIIQWLQLPNFDSTKNQSHSGVSSGELVTNGFDHIYHEFGRPVISATTYFEPENIYSGTSVPTQTYTNEIPTVINHNQEVSSENPNSYQPINNPNYYEPLDNDNHYKPPTNSYQQSENHHQQSEYYYQQSENDYQPTNDHYDQFDNHDLQDNDNYHSTQNYVPINQNPVAPSNEASRPIETVSLPTSVVTLLTDLASKQTNYPRWPIFRPSSEITQNTVVHILNPGSKKPNVTVSEIEVPQVEKPLMTLDNGTNGSGKPPNVHIMFMNEGTQHLETPLPQTIPEVPSKNTNCPTILINSITRVNNTIEGKEACTDINIIINSQVLNTNVFKPGSDGAPSNDDESQDKYVDSSYFEKPQQANDSYNFVGNDNSTTESLYDWDSDEDSDKSDSYDDERDEDSSVFTSTSHVTQESEIFVATGDPQEETFDALGGSVIGDDSSSGVSLFGESSVGGNVPQAISSSLTDTGVAVGQASDVSSSIGQTAGLPGGIGTISGLPTTPGSSLVGNPGNSPGSTALANDDDDDDDYDDDFYMSSTGLMEYVGSIFTYFTFLNPFNYGLFSLAAAPFVAMAAGFIGVAAIFFPWALPGVLDFGRSADRVTIRFKPSLEDVVKHSIHKYRDWHEWKSKRKKRKR